MLQSLFNKMDYYLCEHILRFSVINLFLILGVYATSKGENVCMRRVRHKNKQVYYIEKYCCLGYEMKNETCIRCENGFTSEYGQPCKVCQDNRFGRQCIFRCTCGTTERCDHVQGCVKVLPTTESITTDDSIESTSLLGTELIGETNCKTGDNEVQISQMIGKICTVLVFLLLVSLVFVSLTCICWKYELSCKKRDKITVHAISTHPNESGNNPFQGETHQYDEVDNDFLNQESTINDGHEDVRISGSSTGGSGICGIDSDGYLNPYNALKSIDIRLDQGPSSDQLKTETSFIHTQENTIYFTEQMQN